MVANDVIEISAVTAVKTFLAGFHALSDPLRLQVINLLREKELCVSELCQQLAVNQSKLSFHLKILKEAGLLESRQEGRWIYYRLNLSQFGVLEAYLANYHHSSLILTSHQDCD